MRKIVLITLMTAVAMILNATNEFHGQWYLLATGMPQGDMKMLMMVDCNSHPPIVSITNPIKPSEMVNLYDVKTEGKMLSGKMHVLGISLSISLELTDDHNAVGKLDGRFNLKASKSKFFKMDIDNGGNKLAATEIQKATITLNYAMKGRMPHPERYNNVASTEVLDRSDANFMNEVGLHATVCRVWAGIGFVDEMGFELANQMSDYLMVSYDYYKTDKREQVKHELATLKQRFPKLRYVEVSNELDYNQSKGITADKYYAIYKSMNEIVNEVNKELKSAIPLEIGGPVSSNLNTVWLERFLDDYAADIWKDKRLDFISYHGYFAMSSDMNNRLFYKDNPSLAADQRDYITTQLAKRGLWKETPVFVSELGIYPGPLADDYNSMSDDQLRNAAGMASLLYWYTQSDNIYPMNWVLRHPTEGRKDQLVSHDKDGKNIACTHHLTPYGNMMMMMSKMKNNRITAVCSVPQKNGKGIYAQASMDELGISVMLWNFQSKGTTGYDVTLCLGKIPVELRGKEVKITTYIIDSKTCNHNYDLATSNLHPKENKCTMLKDSEQLKVTLSPNAIMLITIEQRRSAFSSPTSQAHRMRQSRLRRVTGDN